MDPHTIPAFAASLSEPRFRRYLNRYDGQRRLAIRLYTWNIEVSTAFWGPIGVLEIMLRNSIHDALRHGRSDAWWYDGVNLAQREASVLQATINRHAFCNLGGVSRKELHAQLDGITKFRNRIDDALARQRDVITSGSCVI